MSEIPEDVMKRAEALAKQFSFAELSASEAIAQALLSERNRALKEAAEVARAEFNKHNTGSGFDSQPMRAAAHSITTAIEELAK